MKYFHKEINFYVIGHEIVFTPNPHHPHSPIMFRKMIKNRMKKRGKKIELISIVYVFHVPTPSYSPCSLSFSLRTLTTKVQFHLTRECLMLGETARRRAIDIIKLSKKRFTRSSVSVVSRLDVVATR
jgi:hypothetical protein